MIATTAITEETPIRMPRTVRKDLRVLALREARATRTASANGIGSPSTLRVAPPGCNRSHGVGSTIRAVSCERCNQPVETGSVLVSSAVHWSTRPSFFITPGPAFPSARLGGADYFPFPLPLAADRCRGCGWAFVTAGDRCAHAREPGFIFPLASLRWWSGPEPFQASVLFTFNGKTRAGVECETLVRRGFVVSVVDTRVEAARCTTCGSIAFRCDAGPSSADPGS